MILQRARIGSRFSRPQAYVLGGICVLVCTLLLRSPLLNLYENISYTLDPSAARAFDYGERHFNATDGFGYDIDRAQYFFRLAAAQDPMLPYVYHELARIDFLRGNFAAALAKINFQIAMHGDQTPNSYYIRGLIEGYMGAYDRSAADYKHYLGLLSTTNWAGLNDYAWVLLKAGRYEEAAQITDVALRLFPDNPWLLNSNAIAAYERGDQHRALDSARKAVVAVGSVSNAEWLQAYPGNDPAVASQGVESFKKAVTNNLYSIEQKSATSTLQ